jgi:hypothetical protein
MNGSTLCVPKELELHNLISMHFTQLRLLVLGCARAALLPRAGTHDSQSRTFNFVSSSYTTIRPEVHEEISPLAL